MFIILLQIVAALIIAWCGGWVARAIGGGSDFMARWVERTLAILPFIIACVPWAHWWAILAGAGIYGTFAGHGQYFLTLLLKGIKPQFVDPIVTIFFGPDWRARFADGFLDFGYTDRIKFYSEIQPRLFWRNLFGLFVTGTLVGMPAAILALYFHQWMPAASFALTGVVKAAAYAYWIRKTSDTKPAEWTNGIGRNLLALVALWTWSK